VRIGDDFADDRGIAAERMGAHRGKKVLGVALFADGDELALICYVERIEAEKLAGRNNIRLERYRALDKTDTDARLLRDFVQCRAEAASRWVAEAMDRGNRRHHARDKAVQGRAIR